MGVTLIRAHTLGISTGNQLSFETSLGVFNDSNLDAADYAIYKATSLGIRFLVPLTDNYAYYHGGYHDWTDWLGLSKSDFYTDAAAAAAWESYVSHRLQHVNPYTGRAAFEEPAILAWETGNELQQPFPPSAWTIATAQFIKSIDPNHLVLDGRYGVDPATLGSSDVDIHSDHFYPIDLDKLHKDASLCAAAEKPYIAGEFSWVDGDYAGFMSAALANTAVTATAWWSFFPHADEHGFVQHSDGLTAHFPGEGPAMQQFIAVGVAHTAAMAGVSVVPYPVPAPPGLVAASAQAGTVTWQGAALAGNYSVDVSLSGPNGPWNTVCLRCATDNQTPWRVPSGLSVGSFVRVNATNPSGRTGPFSSATAVGR